MLAMPVSIFYICEHSSRLGYPIIFLCSILFDILFKNVYKLLTFLKAVNKTHVYFLAMDGSSIINMVNTPIINIFLILYNSFFYPLKIKRGQCLSKSRLTNPSLTLLYATLLNVQKLN